ncbi:MAG: thioredoxin family protein [Caldilineaceae bacterium]
MFTPPDGLIIVCKRDCPTCTLLEPVYHQLQAGSLPVTIYTQDDPTFPVADAVDDRALAHSFHLGIETVPTLIRVEGGREQARTVGWQRAQWEAIAGVVNLGPDLPAHRPGCGALNVLPGTAEALQVRYGNTGMTARQIEIDEHVDPMDYCFEQGWSDGLPVVPPTPARVWRMLQGTTRSPAEVVGIIPPNQNSCTVEKVAINAVMAGCKPEYMPVVLAAVEAACMEEFCMHGVLATTYFVGPIVIVNGPIAQRIGMNAGVNALGQGNRANATIGRALQLVIRNVGGGKPGEVDRANLGNPGKYTFCFAEREADSPWVSLAVERGFAPTDSTVTLFAGDGVHAVMDQLSRTPESLARTFAAALRSVCHPKAAQGSDAILIVCPEHARVFREAGWSKARLHRELQELLTVPGSELVRGAQGIAEGIPATLADGPVTKFRPGGLMILHVGGTAGMFSAIIGGWPGSGPRGSSPVSRVIGE